MRELGRRTVFVHQCCLDLNAAFGQAQRQALREFDVDEDGHSNLQGWERSRCCVRVKHVSTSTTVGESGYWLKFDAVATRSADEPERYCQDDITNDIDEDWILWLSGEQGRGW